MSGGDNDRARVLLASKFPANYLRDTIEPGLRAIGVDVMRIVETDWQGTIRDVDAVAFMFQMCSHSNYDAFKQRAKTAGIPFVLLSRRAPEWLNAFRLAGVKLPVERSPMSAPVVRLEPASRPVTLVVPPRTFGAALRAARSEEEVTQEFIADLCGVSSALVGHWEADRSPVAADCYDKLTEIFPELETAPAPEMTRKRGHRGPIVEVASPPKAEPIVPVQSVAPLPVKATNGHAIASPLAGLLRAARALGFGGDVVVSVGDGGSVVRIGEESWSGTDDHEAVLKARESLGARLGAQLARLNEARLLLGVMP